jgi:hypothetical protein
MVEYILCYGDPGEHWGLLPATRLASKKILIEQNIKKRTGPALCVPNRPQQTSANSKGDPVRKINGLDKKGSVHITLLQWP